MVQQKQKAVAQIKEHPIIKIKISDLVFDPSNPNVMTDEQMNGLRLSLRKYGYLTPVVVDNQNKIADGEHRAIIYKELGLKEIPAIRMKLETDADRRELRQVLNKLHGIHDKSRDADELVIIFQSQKLPELAEMLAQPEEDLKRQMARFHPEFDFFGKPEEDQDQLDALVEQELNKKHPNAKLGEVFALGKHRLICGDSTQATTMQRLFNDNATVSQLNCDPPYGVEYGDKNEFLNKWDKGTRIQIAIENDKIKIDFDEMFGKIFKNIPWSAYNTIYVWSSSWHLHQIRLALENNKITWGDCLIWVKNNHVLGRKDYMSKHEFIVYGWKGKHKFYGPHRTTILEHDRPVRSALHSTMKPIPLLKQLITDGSQEGEIVLDCFAGSGSSLIACEQTNRIWRGIELSPWFCDVIIKRYETYTGKEATKV